MRAHVRRLAALAVAVVGLGTLSGGPSGALVPLPGAIEEIDYVALGDSYTAGPLVASPREDPYACFRSVNNYPAFLAGYLDVATYTDVSCSGARSRDLWSSQDLYGGATAPPQLDALDAATDLVTLGMGGNDYGLFGSLIGACAELAVGEPHGAPCRRHFTRRVDSRMVDTKSRDARRIADHVAASLALVAERAPNAVVFAVGYPQLLPRSGTCADAPFAAGDYRWFRRITWLLNQSVKQGAQRAGAGYLPVSGASVGHDVCAGDDAWINGSQNLFGVAASYHPFKAGMHGIAAELYHQLTGEVAPPGEDAAPPPGSVVPNS